MAADKEIIDRLIIKDESNPKAIPVAHFIEKVDEFCGDKPVEVLKAVRELYQKYQMMQNSMAQHRQTLKGKVPDIKEALNMVQLVSKRKCAEEDMNVRFQLSDNCYVNATVPAQNTICLWLGANVMLEYTLEEALELLTKNLKNASESLEKLEEDLEYIREQMTTTEVNIARIHNHNVRINEKEKAKAALKAAGK